MALVTSPVLECSFLSNRHQCVKIHNSISSKPPISCGVPQGSILSPTFFHIFINNLLTLPLTSVVHAYADGTTFYISDINPTILQQKINRDLNLIQDWCSANRMVIKSHFLVINQNQNPLSLSINNQKLQQKSSYVLLGFHINDALSWSNHVTHIAHKISSNLRLFYNLRHLMNFGTAKLCYLNFIHSHLIYGIHL